MKQQTLLCLIVLILTTACSSTKSIQRAMDKRSHTLRYLMDTRPVKIKSPIIVRIDSVAFNPALLPKSTTVVREEGMYVPLVLVHYWKAQNTCSLGQSGFLEPLPSFVKSSLINEINRSGQFSADSLSETEYTLDLSIDAFEAKGPYKSEGFFYFLFVIYGFNYYDIAGPAMTQLNITYQLKKNGQPVFSGNHNAKRETEALNKPNVTSSKLQENYAASMVEATSFNIKYINQLIVNDLNNFFRENW
ncbi:MAG: hypothetical protein GXY09_08515 [Bacteroidales bacterium]|nr:hypothetical protein [Bacteroidales bacterium]